MNVRPRLLACWLCATLGVGGWAQMPPDAPGRIVVRLRGSSAVGVAAAGPATSALDAVKAKAGATEARAAFPGSGGIGTAALAQTPAQRFPQREARKVPGIQEPDLSSVYVLTVDSGVDVDALARRLSQDPNVLYAHPDSPVQLQDYMATSGSWKAPTDWNPDGDALDGYDDMWGIKKIHAPDAWLKTKGAGVVVATVDTGLDYNHPGIAGNVQRLTNFAPGANFFQPPFNGQTTPLIGINNQPEAYGPYDPMDDYGHGTHVAGIIAGNGYEGVWGVAPQAKVLPIKTPTGYVSLDAAAIKFAVDNGADVINCSWGWLWQESDRNILSDALAYAAAHGVVVVAAAGNFGEVLLSTYLPAGYPTVIGVAATTWQDKRPSWSNHGSLVVVGAPGGNECAGECNANVSPFLNHEMLFPQTQDRHSILSLHSSAAHLRAPFGDNLGGYPLQLKVGDGTVFRLGGTSMASPMVSGTVALMLAANPSLTVQQVRDKLKQAADPVGDPELGAGRVNANKAVLAALGQLVVTPPPVASAPQAGAIGQTEATITWTTDVAASGSVRYGPTTSYGSSASDPSPQGTSHSVHLIGLTPATAYHFSAQSTGVGGTTASPDAAFTTASPTPCSIAFTSPTEGAAFNIGDGPSFTIKASNCGAKPVLVAVDLNGFPLEQNFTSTTDGWNSDFWAWRNGNWNYNLPGSYTLSATALANGVPVTTHVSFAFKVPDSAAYNDPQYAPTVMAARVSDVTDTSAIIHWTTDRFDLAEVRYGLSTIMESVVFETTPAVEHAIKLENLRPGTRYFARAAGNGVLVFQTTGAPPAAPNIVLLSPLDWEPRRPDWKQVTIVSSVTLTTGLDRVEYYDNGALIKTYTETGQLQSNPSCYHDYLGHFACQYSYDVAGDGMHLITAKVYDKAGRSASSQAVRVYNTLSSVAPPASQGLRAVAAGPYIFVGWKADVFNFKSVGLQSSADGVAWTDPPYGYRDFFTSYGPFRADFVSMGRPWGLTAGKTYYYRLHFVNPYGESYSNVVSAVAQALPAAVVSAPAEGATVSSAVAVSAATCDADAKVELYDGQTLLGTMSSGTTSASPTAR